MKTRQRIFIFRNEFILTYQRIRRSCKINRNVKTCRKQIEAAIAKGQIPEPCVWDNPQ